MPTKYDRHRLAGSPPQAKPKLGQNFLIDDAARYRIADALGDIAQTTVLEIGPGHGAITDILAGRARRLVCIELDRALAAELQFRFRNHTNVEILQADILTTDLTALVPVNTRARIVGNLPYYITSDILLHLCAHAGALDIAVIMMQREVADRVAAVPGTRDYGALSVSLQMHAEVNTLFTLPPEAFAPPPEVYSTVLRLSFSSRFAALGITDPAAFIRFVRTCFQQKRKTLGNNLRAANFTPDAIRNACATAQIPPTTRAEELSLATFAALYRAFGTHSVGPDDARPRQSGLATPGSQNG